MRFVEESLSCEGHGFPRMNSWSSFVRTVRIALRRGAWRGGIDGGSTRSLTAGLLGLQSRAQLSFLGRNHCL